MNFGKLGLVTALALIVGAGDAWGMQCRRGSRLSGTSRPSAKVSRSAVQGSRAQSSRSPRIPVAAAPQADIYVRSRELAQRWSFSTSANENNAGDAHFVSIPPVELKSRTAFFRPVVSEGGFHVAPGIDDKKHGGKAVNRAAAWWFPVQAGQAYTLSLVNGSPELRKGKGASGSVVRGRPCQSCGVRSDARGGKHVHFGIDESGRRDDSSNGGFSGDDGDGDGDGGDCSGGDDGDGDGDGGDCSGGDDGDGDGDGGDGSDGDDGDGDGLAVPHPAGSSLLTVTGVPSRISMPPVVPSATAPSSFQSFSLLPLLAVRSGVVPKPVPVSPAALGAPPRVPAGRSAGVPWTSPEVFPLGSSSALPNSSSSAAGDSTSRAVGGDRDGDGDGLDDSASPSQSTSPTAASSATNGEAAAGSAAAETRTTPGEVLPFGNSDGDDGDGDGDGDGSGDRDGDGDDGDGDGLADPAASSSVILPLSEESSLAVPSGFPSLSSHGGDGGDCSGGDDGDGDGDGGDCSGGDDGDGDGDGLAVPHPAGSSLLTVTGVPSRISMPPVVPSATAPSSFQRLSLLPLLAVRSGVVPKPVPVSPAALGAPPRVPAGRSAGVPWTSPEVFPLGSSSALPNSSSSAAGDSTSRAVGGDRDGDGDGLADPAASSSVILPLSEESSLAVPSGFPSLSSHGGDGGDCSGGDDGDGDGDGGDCSGGDDDGSGTNETAAQVSSASQQLSHDVVPVPRAESSRVVVRPDENPSYDRGAASLLIRALPQSATNQGHLGSRDGGDPLSSRNSMRQGAQLSKVDCDEISDIEIADDGISDDDDHSDANPSDGDGGNAGICGGGVVRSNGRAATLAQCFDALHGLCLDNSQRQEACPVDYHWVAGDVYDANDGLTVIPQGVAVANGIKFVHDVVCRDGGRSQAPIISTTMTVPSFSGDDDGSPGTVSADTVHLGKFVENPLVVNRVCHEQIPLTYNVILSQDTNVIIKQLPNFVGDARQTDSLKIFPNGSGLYVIVPVLNNMTAGDIRIHRTREMKREVGSSEPALPIIPIGQRITLAKGSLIPAMTVLADDVFIPAGSIELVRQRTPSDIVAARPSSFTFNEGRGCISFDSRDKRTISEAYECFVARRRRASQNGNASSAPRGKEDKGAAARLAQKRNDSSYCNTDPSNPWTATRKEKERRTAAGVAWQNRRIGMTFSPKRVVNGVEIYSGNPEPVGGGNRYRARMDGDSKP